MFARARPVNADYVATHSTAKISERYFIGHRRLRPSQVAKWQTRNPGWAQQLKKHLRDPATFESVAHEMASAIKNFATTPEQSR
jgi:hypothetical protein